MADNKSNGIAIRVRGLVTRFGPVTIHEDLDLDVRTGEILGVVGGSGTGKSVLLRTIIGLHQPHSGEVEIFGVSYPPPTLAARREVESGWGVLFQDGALFGALTVAQNVAVPLREHLHMSQALMDEIAMAKICMVGLKPEDGAKYPSELSGGMRKRAGLARALAMDPRIVFLDEPTAGLDPIAAAAFDELIRGLRDALGLTVFMVTHDLDSLNAVCDRIAVLVDGRVKVVGDMAEMLRQDHPWIREYFHGPRSRAGMEGPKNQGRGAKRPRGG